jgi:hypothetical protein
MTIVMKMMMVMVVNLKIYITHMKIIMMYNDNHDEDDDGHDGEFEDLYNAYENDA